MMLPQGEFSRLLHGSGKDRQALLGELTGLDHVQAMQRVASDRTKELKHQSQTLNTLLDGEYAGVSPEAAAALRARREETDAHAERLTDTRERLLSQQHRLRDQEKVWRAREDALRRLGSLEARAASVQEGAERAARARRVAGVLPLLDAAERARIAQEREARELTRAQEAARVAGAAAAQAQTALQAAQQAESGIPELEAREERCARPRPTLPACAGREARRRPPIQARCRGTRTRISRPVRPPRRPNACGWNACRLKRRRRRWLRPAPASRPRSRLRPARLPNVTASSGRADLPRWTWKPRSRHWRRPAWKPVSPRTAHTCMRETTAPCVARRSTIFPTPRS
ncbi:hypothetical protein ACFSC4_07340 [Deinococcus malanensis]|uniref:hypothetical protein n=1 Tax=Deinococcus malanensis TaxID=1706855 RepID=UPI00362EF350